MSKSTRDKFSAGFTATASSSIRSVLAKALRPKALPAKPFLRKLAFKASVLTLILGASLGFSTSINVDANKAFATELEAKITDNLSSELGFPIYSWAPEDTPQAVLVAIHGATLHGRSYTTVGKELSKKGYAVFAPDMRGYGAWYHNSEANDELARHVLFGQSEADLKNLLKKVHELYPNKPVFLMGESVGANMAIRLLVNDANCADGMILSSPAIKQRYFFGPTVMKQLMTVFFWNPGAQLDISPFLKSRVSDDERITEERISDPLGRTRLNVGELWKTRWFNKDCIKMLPQLPNNISVLVLEGSDDKLFRADLIQEELMTPMPCQDKTLHLLKGKGHIHLETKYLKDEVEKTLAEWLEEKCHKYAQKPKEAEVSDLGTALGHN